MSEPLADSPSFNKKLLLAAIGIAAVAGPVGFGLVSGSPKMLAQSAQANGAVVQLLHANDAAVQPFEVVSIRPTKPGGQAAHGGSFDRFYVPSETIKDLIKFAYNIKLDQQLSGGPSWINTEKYDIEAKIDEATAEKIENIPLCQSCALPKDVLINQHRLMVQAMLADRFKLRVNFVTREFPLYALVVAKGGPRMKESLVPITPGVTEMGIKSTGPGQLRGLNARTGLLAIALQHDLEIDRYVVDKTGLNGYYDWTLTWTPEQGAAMVHPPGGPASAGTPPPDTPGPSIFEALQKQLGLKLESQKGPVETLVIDHIERPSEN